METLIQHPTAVTPGPSLFLSWGMSSQGSMAVNCAALRIVKDVLLPPPSSRLSIMTASRSSGNNAPSVNRLLWTVSGSWLRGAAPGTKRNLSVTPMVDKNTLRRISRFCGFPRLYTLPLELLEMIRQQSRHSLVWKCIPALKLADCVSTLQPDPLLTVPLRDVLSWERGGKLECVAESRSPPLPPILRLTVDSLGISKVERLPALPVYTGECASHLALIVENETYLPGAVA